MPVAVPDSVVDFLEDFNHASALQTDSSRSSLDEEYLKAAGEELKGALEKLRAELGQLQKVNVDQAGRDAPGAYLAKLQFEKGSRGLGLLTRLKERTILRVIFGVGEYDEAALKELVKNPPRS